MQKYGDNSPVDVYRGEQAAVINNFIKKFGKSISEFSDDERAQLDHDLAAVAPEPEPVVEEKPAPKPKAKAAPKKDTDGD